MKTKILLILTLSILSVTPSLAQQKTTHQEINEVWYKFYEAFDSLDYQIMADIHSRDLIRIPGGKSILDYDTYINNYKTQFTEARKNHTTQSISLRFTERTHTDSIASERGIYKFTVNQGKDDEQSFYGAFHVILRKENGVWKITMDYDSSEGGTVGEEEYLKGSGLVEDMPEI